MTGDDLIMEVTEEQGPERSTQVQPPRDAWIQYFGLDLRSTPPTLRLRNARDIRSPGRSRPVVGHHHIWTIEIAEASAGSIIRFRKKTATSYDYWLYRPGDGEYAHCRWMLDTFKNPYRRRGRKWLIV